MGFAVLLVEGLPQLMILAMTMTHWHSRFETVAMELFCTSVNIPLSVLYLSFYCNPRVQQAVVAKILMEGLQASAKLYGEYVEKYVHVENKMDDVTPVDENDKTSNTLSYDASSILSVLAYQVCYIIICPLVGLKEMGIAMRDSLIRDFGGRNDIVNYNTESNTEEHFPTKKQETGNEPLGNFLQEMAIFPGN